MNGSNYQEERDQRPLYLCPVCLCRLGWNLQVEPIPCLTKLKSFCQEQGFGVEARWYEKAIPALTG